MHDNMCPGQVAVSVTLDGHFGFFSKSVALGATSGLVLLVCAGVGVTPFISMLRGLFASANAALAPSTNGLSIDAHLLYSARSEQELAFRSELEAYASSDSAAGGHALRLHLTLTGEPPPIWSGLRGRITGSMVTTVVPDYLRRTIYICGPEGFMQSLSTELSDKGGNGYPIGAMSPHKTHSLGGIIVVRSFLIVGKVTL
eukprot:NODE_1477_length_1151_cov_96.542650_g1209_i0.p1 GENE.NODE_1477_length_1151_cov_96.542650_g1209_i0~~NODE_1477_length_1151_cov_96.542650_g1209_i0.p1  ORF type:complete len:200 (+),score=46.49 NODE_1477_length_1151_cov_96.542650_g1209_i0:333-932(+)